MKKVWIFFCFLLGGSLYIVPALLGDPVNTTTCRSIAQSIVTEVKKSEFITSSDVIGNDPLELVEVKLMGDCKVYRKFQVNGMTEMNNNDIIVEYIKTIQRNFDVKGETLKLMNDIFDKGVQFNYVFQDTSGKQINDVFIIKDIGDAKMLIGE